MREYGFQLTRHDEDRPWLIVSTEHLTVELEDGVNFPEWAGKQWPSPHWTVQPDPFTDAPEWR
jgi:hypothetical protein